MYNIVLFCKLHILSQNYKHASFPYQENQIKSFKENVKIFSFENDCFTKSYYFCIFLIILKKIISIYLN